ncbi:MAG: four helix bundle protein [Nevskia sp.]|nr:four helix bundle protein [Nevskia sp.]
MSVRGYEDLVVWQKAMLLVREVYLLTADMPDAERFGLTAQIRRAAVSVPSNIAEGQGRLSTGEFKQFLGNARGSLYELETQMRLMTDLNLVDDVAAANILATAGDVARLLNGLINSLKAKTGH